MGISSAMAFRSIRIRRVVRSQSSVRILPAPLTPYLLTHRARPSGTGRFTSMALRSSILQGFRTVHIASNFVQEFCIMRRRSCWRVKGELRTVIAAALLLGSMISSPVAAQWLQMAGPYNGKPTCCVAFADALYLGTGYSVYRSSDRGIHWSLASQGLPRPAYICSITTDDRFLYIGTEGLGTFRSSDSGRNWNRLVNAPFFRSVSIARGNKCLYLTDRWQQQTIPSVSPVY